MSIYTYAEQYFNLGLKPTCISYLKTEYNIGETNPEKSPCHSWRRWQVRKPKLEDIQNLPWDNSIGIGTVLGYINRCIDIDNCSDLNLIIEILKLLNLPIDYEWVIKTPNGFHIHVISSNLPFVTDKDLHEGVLALLPNDNYKSKFGRIELRWANHAVLPPTIINGMSYKFVFCSESMPKEKPRSLTKHKLFTALAKFCGESKNNGEDNKILINNLEFNVTFCSGDSSTILSAYNRSNKELPNSEDKKLIGYFTDDGEKDWPDQTKNYYRNYLDHYIFIDIETTGLIKDQTDYDSYPRIIQIAHTYNKDSKIINNYIKPEGFTVPHDIEQLTGLSHSFLIENGVPIQQALNSLNGKEITNPIICYNSDFDISILDSEFIRLKQTNSNYYGNHLRDGSQIFCLMKKINSVFGGKYLTLSEAYELLFKDPRPLGSHNAVNDLEILIDCFRLLDLYGFISLGNKGRTLE